MIHRAGTNFVLERVSNPEIEPVDLPSMKRHLRAFDDVTGEDDDITNLIVAGREWVEDFTGRALIDQVWRLSFGDRLSVDTVLQYGYRHFQALSDGIYLRRSPVLAITSFVSVDAAGVETTIDPATYELREGDSKWPRLVGLAGASWCTGLFRVTFRAGYADRVGSPQQDASLVPERYKQAIKLWVEANYDRDEKMMPLLIQTAENIIKPERVNLQIA